MNSGWDHSVAIGSADTPSRNDTKGVDRLRTLISNVSFVETLSGWGAQ